MDFNMLSRRTVLRGMGASIALPWLNVMAAPARLIATGTSKAVEIPQRIAFAYIPNGVIGSKWFPKSTGRDFDLPASLRPLEKLKSELVFVSGLDRTFTSGSDPHSQCGSCWLTTSPPTEQLDGISPINRTLDQMIASSNSGATPFRSLELSCNSFTDSREAITHDSISWYSPGNSARSEKNPLLVFKRLFGEARGLKKSVLDAVSGQAMALQQRVGSQDRQTIEEYLESIRSIEKRIEIQRSRQVNLADFGFQEPTEIPADRGEYIRLMSDLMLMAYQTDSTRVATLMVGPERWASPQLYPGVFDKPVDHHTMTHDHALDDQVALIDRFHMEQFAYMIGKMRNTKEANGQSLLDNCLLVVGSGLGEGMTHSYKELPLMLAGSKSIGIKPGQHVRFDDKTPLANFWLMLGNKFGLNLDRFADSSGELKLT
jgi:hypothetical protein